MATFSPSPAPRRSSRLRYRDNPAVTVPVSRPVSRFATPLPSTNHGLTDHASLASGMDIDEESSVLTEIVGSKLNSETVFAKSDELTSSFYANLPVEVKQILKNADFSTEDFTGEIDTVTGYTLVANAKTCFVWQHAQALRGIPTCYIFSCPRDYNSKSTPCHALIPYGSSREPGLILITPGGQVRSWSSISIGLAGGEHYSTTQLALNDEEINYLVRSDAQTFVASTTKGRMFCLNLASGGGKFHLTSHPFSRPVQSRSFSSLLPSFFQSSSSSNTLTDSVDYIDSITLGHTTPFGEKQLYTFAKGWLHKWLLRPEGWEELLWTQDMDSILDPAIRAAFPNYQSVAHLDVEILDIVVDDDDKVSILISHAGLESVSLMEFGTPVRRIYALAFVSIANDQFTVESVKSVPYQSTFLSGVDTHPRMQMLCGGSVLSVQFGDAVAFCAKNSEYGDRLELKAITDRTLGVGVNKADDTMLILTATSMIQVRLDLDKIVNFNPETGRPNLIKSIMMQAILYGVIPENPLHFSFPPDLDEDDLMKAAEQLSDAVLHSDSEVVRRNHDLSSQIEGRKERLSWLIQFINDNAVLGKISQRCRQRLATDAEKLYACQQLWQQYNELLSKNPNHSVLNDCVHAYMDEIKDGPHEDVMRTFFRHRVGDIGRMIKKVTEALVLYSRETGNDIVELLPEANNIVITVLRSAFDYRAYNFGVYGIELPMISPWTSRPLVIDVVLTLFDITTKETEDPSDDQSLLKKIEHPKGQLPHLASVLFESIQERLDYLRSAVDESDPSVRRDRDDLEQKFGLLRPEVLETLRRTGHQEAAFLLAEKYRDFSSLAALCHRETVYPPEENPNAERIQSYIGRFKDEFTKELIQWYIQHGELRLMFSPEIQPGYLDRFFVEKPNDSISWIHDLDKQRYGAAAEALLHDAEDIHHLEARHLMLSIGKLAHLAQTFETNVPANEEVLDAFHDGLDFVSVHEALTDEFRSALDSKRGRQSLESQIDIIMKAKATKLQDRTALALVFRDLLRQLLQKKALSVEDAVDLLTLKDNMDTVGDFTTALHLLTQVRNLPDTRKISAFRTVWRRIYTHDDWEVIRKTANISDTELNERFRSTALYATLCTTLPRINQPLGYETSPDEALMIPTSEEIAGRWPGISPEQVDTIAQDYILECDRLGDLELDDVYHRIRELAEQDME